MIRYVVLLAVALTALADKAEDMKKCIEILHIHKECCKVYDFKKRAIQDETFRECMHIPEAPGSCDRQMCYGTKKGIVTDDGTVKVEVLSEYLEEMFADHKQLIEAVKERCIDGNWQEYGKTDDCDIGKMLNCIGWQVKFGCPEFIDDGSCEGSKDAAKKCMDLVS